MKYDNLLGEFLKGPDLLKDKIKNVSIDLLLFKPLVDNAWTIKEHAIHIVDSEINNFIRWKSILAQPFSKCFVIDEENWTKNLNYEQEDMDRYLDVFTLLRVITYDYLKTIHEDRWNQDYYVHEHDGKTNNITLEKTIEIYTKHLYRHFEYIDRNIKLWESR